MPDASQVLISKVCDIPDLLEKLQTCTRKQSQQKWCCLNYSTRARFPISVKLSMSKTKPHLEL